jgi:hypothetical protein
MSKIITCNHLVGYYGSDDSAKLAKASDKNTFSDFEEDGVRFRFCPYCGQKIKWIDPESDSPEEA